MFAPRHPGVRQARNEPIGVYQLTDFIERLSQQFARRIARGHPEARSSQN